MRRAVKARLSTRTLCTCLSESVIILLATRNIGFPSDKSPSHGTGACSPVSRLDGMRRGFAFDKHVSLLESDRILTSGSINQMSGAAKSSHEG